MTELILEMVFSFRFEFKHNEFIHQASPKVNFRCFCSNLPSRITYFEGVNHDSFIQVDKWQLKLVNLENGEN